MNDQTRRAPDRRAFYLQRMQEAEVKATLAANIEVAETWHQIAKSWRTMADEADRMTSKG